MDASETAPESTVLEIHECWRSLRSSSIGRLAVVGPLGPEIFPVNYLPEDGTVIIRTGPGTKLDALRAGGPAVLEADGFNAYGTIAWSVIVKGRPEPVPDDDPSRDLVDHKLLPWEPGVKDHVFRILPTAVTGRRFVTSPPGRWWSPREPGSPGAEPGGPGAESRPGA
ncbi:pyridoxamine 5'-phosphate oxidase family protein [Specibacter sp. RAF43]|uniref:pyridoxamine 5'-phosphate oxidase family protein n=1 Tax=Specibacter sp. RAF43 TaxID=3233057 RepID=UPI003F9519C1